MYERKLFYSVHKLSKSLLCNKMTSKKVNEFCKMILSHTYFYGAEFFSNAVENNLI